MIVRVLAAPEPSLTAIHCGLWSGPTPERFGRKPVAKRASSFLAIDSAPQLVTMRRTPLALERAKNYSALVELL